MKEATGNLWDQRADAICITTNGYVTVKGMAVMGAGCALEAVARLGSGIARELGDLISSRGNHAFVLLTPRHGWYDDDFAIEERIEIISFPVKTHWREKADLGLIRQSATEVVEIADLYGFKSVVVPRPGCGNGGLKWENVKPVLEPILDDRFTIITF